ncbi:MAG: hypothetical protein RIT32_874 [Actinomycetota bacterium]
MASSYGLLRARSKIRWHEVIVVTVHQVPADKVEHFAQLAAEWLTQLAQLPGWVSGSLGRSVDEIDHWLIQQQWEDAGSCRRGLSATQLRPIAFELAQSTICEVSTFEPLLIATSDQVQTFDSIRAADADSFSLSDNKLIDEV